MGCFGNADKGMALVVGANKGIGLGLCRVLKQDGYDVVATCRVASPELDELAIKVVQGVDVTKADGLQPLMSVLQTGVKVLLLVVCAGYQKLDGLQDLDFEDLDKHWQVNAAGPLRVVKAVLPSLVPSSSKVLLLSSKMGSQGAKDIPAGGGLYGYRMSKTALNMAGKLLAEDLAAQQIPVGIVHPGPVHTDMLRSLRTARGVTEEAQLAAGTISVEQSASSICKYISTFDMSSTGQYWAADTGTLLPW